MTLRMVVMMLEMQTGRLVNLDGGDQVKLGHLISKLRHDFCHAD